MTARQQPRFPHAAWVRLGNAIQEARMAEGMSVTVLAYATHSSNKSLMRIEQGRVYSVRSDAPPADYNSAKYVLKRLHLIDRALGWEKDTALAILDPVAIVRPKK